MKCIIFNLKHIKDLQIYFFLNSVILFLFIKKRFINTWDCITMKHKKKGLERSKPFSV
jgi:hypothetical protein